MRWTKKKLVVSYHFNWAECNNGVATPAVGPGIPARILPLLKHILFPLTAGLLVSHPSDRTEERDKRLIHLSPTHSVLHLSVCCYKSFSASEAHSRSTQHQYGAHFLHACFLEVVTRPSQLMAASLEVFLLIDDELGIKGAKKKKGEGS